MLPSFAASFPERSFRAYFFSSTRNGDVAESLDDRVGAAAVLGLEALDAGPSSTRLSDDEQGRDVGLGEFRVGDGGVQAFLTLIAARLV
jgi:hypothetical protein